MFNGEAHFHPFVVSTRATFEDRTSKIITTIAEQAIRKGFARELSNRIKVALLEYEVFRRKALNLRKTNGTLDREAADPKIPRFIPTDSDSEPEPEFE
jgi:DNA-binding SARP family transcriptional activator